MKKRIGILLVGLFVFMLCLCANAKEKVYYTNPNGVELNQYEYVFLQNFYFDSFPEHITQEQYDELVKYDLFNGTVERETFTYPEPTRGDSHVTNAKTLVISKSCSSNCIVSLQNTWTYDPYIRSYDDIGFYFLNSSMISHSFTIASSTTSYQTFSNIISNSSGFGNTVKLPDTGTNVVVASSIVMNTGGHIYGSYQHATVNTTVNVAQNYSFSLGGYGHVFLFGSNAAAIYDGMGGVDLSL